MHYEIERKFLIDRPDHDCLVRQPDCNIWEIEQIYLTADPGETRRIRKVTEKDSVIYYRTFKRRITNATAAENESEITKEAYEAYLSERNPELNTILKRRYRIPFEGHLLEIDVCPFWKKQAVLEIELASETEPYRIPDWLNVKREVTDDKRYKNIALAHSIPEEESPAV